MITSKLTATLILALIGLVFYIDALLEWFGYHATISETTSSFIYKKPAFFALVFIAIGMLLGHWLFSVNYQ